MLLPLRSFICLDCRYLATAYGRLDGESIEEGYESSNAAQMMASVQAIRPRGTLPSGTNVVRFLYRATR